MKSLTTKLPFVLALLLFGTMQQIHAQKWTGTWNTNLGKIKITEDSNGKVTFGLGDYSFSGKTTKNLANMGQTVTGNYFVSPRTNSPQGAKPVDYDKYGDRGTFTLTSDKTGQSFKGEWKNEANASKKGPINGKIIYEVSKSINDDIKVTNQKNVSQEDLKNRQVDISGANLKAPVPWVGTWTSGNDKWKIIQRSLKGIQIKRSHINKDGHTIESDMSASQTGISKDGKTIYYNGTCTEQNRTTKKTVSVPIQLETSATNSYNTIKTTLDYTNRKNKPAVYNAENFTLKRINHDRPDMSTYK